MCAFDKQPMDVRSSFWTVLTRRGPTFDCAKVKACKSNPRNQPGKMEQCYAGARGDDLLEEASKMFTAAYPKPVYMPRTRVQGVDVDADYDDVKKALCAAGAAAPVCSNLE